MIAALLALGGFALVCGTTVAVRWIDRCDCRFANEIHQEPR